MFNPPKPDRELDQFPVASNSLALAAPDAHPLSKFNNLRLRHMTDARFIWFPRRESAQFYDRLMYECFRGGLKSPRIVQEASNEATILTLVAQGMGVGFVVETARWRCPDGVVRLKVADQAVVAIGSRLEKGQPVPATLQICDRRRGSGEAETDDAAGWPVAESSLASGRPARSSKFSRRDGQEPV